MDEQKPAGKPFEISKQEVWDAWLKVKANGGRTGSGRAVDRGFRGRSEGQSL